MQEVHPCPGCGDERPLADFYQTAAGGHMRVCKACHTARVIRRQAERYAQDPDYRADKNARVIRRQAERYAQDPEYRADKNARVILRQNVRYSEDTRYALGKAFSAVLRESLVEGKAGRHWEDIVGYTLEDLMAHLESRFEPGMTWENYGTWHIDHIVPRAAFDYVALDDPGFRECWALSNLQPLWSEDNIKKSDLMAHGTRARHRGDSSRT